MRTDLNSVAQGWADHMAAAGLLSHNPQPHLAGRQLADRRRERRRRPRCPDARHRVLELTGAQGQHPRQLLQGRRHRHDLRRRRSAGSRSTSASRWSPSPRAPSQPLVRRTVHRTLRVGSRGTTWLASSAACTCAPTVSSARAPSARSPASSAGTTCARPVWSTTAPGSSSTPKPRSRSTATKVSR